MHVGEGRTDHDRMRHVTRQIAAACTLVALLASLLSLGCSTSTDSSPEPTATVPAAATATATITTTPSPSPIPTATPVPDPLVLDQIGPGMQALQQRLQEEVASFSQRVGGNFAVAVTDLQTGMSVHVNGNDGLRIPGCTMNFFVLLQTVKDLQAGLYPEYEAGSFIAQTIWASDPGTAHYLLNKTGDGNGLAGLVKIRRLLLDLGLDSAIYDHPPAAGDVVSLTPNRWHENRISPLDFNRALAMLYYGELLDPEWTAYLIDKMTRVKPGLNHLLPSGVTDPNARVAHKNGYIDYVPYYVDNDIGIVMFNRDGKEYAYVLTFWSQDNPWVLSDVTLGQTVSRLVWDHFNATYTPPGPQAALPRQS